MSRGQHILAVRLTLPSFVDGLIQWRLPIAFQAFFTICLVLQMLPLPETPRFLIETGRNFEGTKVVARPKGHASIEEREVVHLRRQIETSVEVESRGGTFS